MKKHLPFLLVLASCGSTVKPDHTIEVAYADNLGLDYGAVGDTEWDSKGRTKVWVETHTLPWQTPLILRHEIWHAVTHNEGHSPNQACGSNTDLDPERDVPCEEDMAQMPEGQFHFSFPENPWALKSAAIWWNTSLHRKLITFDEPEGDPPFWFQDAGIVYKGTSDREFDFSDRNIGD